MTWNGPCALLPAGWWTLTGRGSSSPTAGMVNGDTAPQPAAFQAQTIDRMGNSETARGVRERARCYAPDPASVGIAGQVVHGLISGVAKMTTYVAAGPALFGLYIGINRALELTDALLAIQGTEGRASDDRDREPLALIKTARDMGQQAKVW